MNKYAEVKYGKVVGVYADERDFAIWKSIFSPNAFWVDVTGQNVNKGDVVTLSEAGLIFEKANQSDGIDTPSVVDTMQSTIDSLREENEELRTQLSDINDALVEMMFGDEFEL